MKRRGFVRNCNAGNPVLNCGANYNNANANYGVFYMNSNNAGNSNSNLGARLLRTTLTSNARSDPRHLPKI